MYRDQLTDLTSQSDHDADGASTVDQGNELPSALQARVDALGPGHAAVLGELLIAYPMFASRILSAASPRVGLAAVRRAIAMASGQAPSTVGPDSVDTEAAAPSEAAVAPSEAGAGGLSAHAVSTARRYNLAHGHHVAIFNEATTRRFVDSDGQPDPAQIWQWQREHGIGQDGRIGPQTSSTAVAVARRERAAETAAQTTAPPPVAAPEPVAPAPEPVAPAPVAAPEPAAPAPVAAPEPVAPPPVAAAEPVAPAPVAAPEPAAPAPESAAPAPVAAPEPAAPPPTAVATHSDSAIEPASAPSLGGGGAPPAPARVDNGGPGSLARRTLSTQGTADAAFAFLVSDNDATLDKNLADYGDVAEQRALLDGVIAEGKDPVRVRRAFHAYWHIQLVAAGEGTKSVRDWPVPTLQLMHTQLKQLPDQDARAGHWKKLSLSDEARKRGRGWYDEKGDFSLGADARAATDRKVDDGYFEYVQGAQRAGTDSLQVFGGERFKVGDTVSIGRGTPAHEVVTVAVVSGNTYKLGAPLRYDHLDRAIMELQGNRGQHEVNWLEYTVRHEIAHSLDGRAVDTRGFYAKGGWATFGDFDSWVKAMGGESAWATNDGARIPDEDRVAIKGAINLAMMSHQTGSLFDPFRSGDPKTQHPIVKYEHKAVPVLLAAQASMYSGDGFVQHPTELYAANNKRFSVSYMYNRYQHCNETALTDRVSNYSLTAPAEFFADTYAMFYEEAGKPGITDADHGRLIRNDDWRTWFREHVHNRGHGPAGTGAAKKPDGTLADDLDHGARPSGAQVGRASGNPGAEHG